ncbi:C2H2 type zinc finger domain protein [Fusarium austroafricanum]|uniref:C2H2 type zinc finger domain protein n=1 Tax=Fusarium austroafricanum TaxID=2364996 RepID=A0A8H4KPQ9_9HYPO|nr:C2H2 type zinc finger domain protein [Fusarium austroafricanum]
MEKATDEYGRLKIWGVQRRATLPPSARGSLDDDLRHDQTLRDNVAKIFRLLARQLEIALPIVAHTAEEPSALDPDIDNFSSSESDYWSSDSSDKHVFKTRQRSKIAVLMTHVYEQVKLLYHLDALLRRPQISNRYLKSTDRYRGVSAFEKYDYQHIEEKHRQWIQSSNQSRGHQSDDRIDELSPEVLIAHKSLIQVPKSFEAEPSASQDDLRLREVNREQDQAHIIISRLAQANTRRREQLRYWERHPHCERHQEDSPVSGKGPRIPRLGFERGRDRSTPGDKSLTSIPTTAHSFSTVAASAIDETQTDPGRPRTVYEASVGPGQQSARVPDIPKVAYTDEQFECPYCHTMLESSLIRNRMSWKHVFRDLRPYVCTYIDCPNPDKMYATRHDWIYHEMQMHRREWKCQCCDVIFGTRNLMVDHLRSVHSDSLTTQLSLLLDLSERPMDDNATMKCILCSGDLYLNRLLKHLAQHMEEIALFVLPASSDDNDDVNSNAARKSRAEDINEGGLNTPLSSLNFSEIDYTERSQQFAEDFTKLNLSEEQSAESRLSVWHDDDPADTANSEEIEGEIKDLQVEIMEKSALLGLEHPDTLMAKEQLARLYYSHNRIDAAKDLGDQALEGYLTVLGQEHPHTLVGMLDSAILYRRKGQFDEAERLVNRVLKARKAALGEQDPETLATLAKLSRIYGEQDRWDEAEENLTKALKLMTEALGDGHRQTLKVLNDLALTLGHLGRFDEAEELISRGLKLMRSELGQEDELTLRSTQTMAVIWAKQGRMHEAIVTLRELLSRMKKLQGDDHPDTASLETILAECEAEFEAKKKG